MPIVSCHWWCNQVVLHVQRSLGKTEPKALNSEVHSLWTWSSDLWSILLSLNWRKVGSCLYNWSMTITAISFQEWPHYWSAPPKEMCQSSGAQCQITGHYSCSGDLNRFPYIIVAIPLAFYEENNVEGLGREGFSHFIFLKSLVTNELIFGH